MIEDRPIAISFALGGAIVFLLVLMAPRISHTIWPPHKPAVTTGAGPVAKIQARWPDDEVWFMSPARGRAK
jgi:hypothetical protein